MAIRYFSNRYKSGFDDGERYIFSDPYIRETVQAFDDPRDADALALGRPRESEVAYMQAYHYPSTEAVNFDTRGMPRHPDTTEFFTHHPKSTMVDLAFSDPSMRHTMPTIGAYFANKYGELTISGSLSKHSSKLSRNALDRGLPVTPSVSNPDVEVTNDHTFNAMSAEIPRNWPKVSETAPIPDQEVRREIPDYEIKEAKNYLREALGRKKPLSNQFNDHVDHPQLPGMEQY